MGSFSSSEGLINTLIEEYKRNITKINYYNDALVQDNDGLVELEMFLTLEKAGNSIGTNCLTVEEMTKLIDFQEKKQATEIQFNQARFNSNKHNWLVRIIFNMKQNWKLRQVTNQKMKLLIELSSMKQDGVVLDKSIRNPLIKKMHEINDSLGIVRANYTQQKNPKKNLDIFQQALNTIREKNFSPNNTDLINREILRTLYRANNPQANTTCLTPEWMKVLRRYEQVFGTPQRVAMLEKTLAQLESGDVKFDKNAAKKLLLSMNDIVKDPKTAEPGKQLNEWTEPVVTSDNTIPPPKADTKLTKSPKLKSR